MSGSEVALMVGVASVGAASYNMFKGRTTIAAIAIAFGVVALFIRWWGA